MRKAFSSMCWKCEKVKFFGLTKIKYPIFHTTVIINFNCSLGIPGLGHEFCHTIVSFL